MNKKIVGMLPSLTSHKTILYLISLTIFTSCFQDSAVKINVNRNKPTKTTSLLNVNISKIQIINHQVVITGTNLNKVSNFKINEGSNNTNLQIESQTSTTLIANTISNVTFAAGKVFNFILSDADAAATFIVDFSLCNSSLNGKGFSCVDIPNDKEVLSYDADTGLWLPRAVNGLSYQGVWDANSGFPTTTTPGNYYIVSEAHGVYGIGDWIVFNGITFDQIVNSNSVPNVFGRVGGIVATKGDYSLTQLADVNVTTITPVSGNVLKFDGTNWVPGVLSAGNSGTVTNVSGTAPVGVSNGATTPTISITQASSTTNGYLSSTDWNTFNGKQNSIANGSTTQYFRGDKTFVTLDTSVVPENGNLYFNNARVLSVQASGFSATNSAISASDTILQAIGKAQGQINNIVSGGSNYLVKNGVDSISGQVTVGGIGQLVLNYVPSNLTDAVNKQYVDNSEVWSVLSGNTYRSSGRVGIGTSTPAAALDITSTTSGLLIPRMTTAQKNAIATPGTGMQVYDSSTNLLNFYNGSSWQALGVAGSGVTSITAGTGLSGGTITTAGTIGLGTELAGLNGLSTTGFVRRTGSGSYSAAAIALATDVSGILPITNGGTGATITPVNGGIIYSTATTMAVTAAGTSGQILISNGAAAPSWITSLPIANGGTGATTQAGAQTALGITTAGLTATGNLAGNVPLVGIGGIVANNVCMGASTGGGISCATTTSGTGNVVLNSAPTITNPIINNISPAADFTLTQNAVVPFTSEGTGAVANTLLLKAGNVGIGNTNPGAKLEITSGTSNTSGLKFSNLNSASPAGTGQAVGVDASGNLIRISSGSSGTVTSITAGTGLTGGTISTSGTIGLGTELTNITGLTATGYLKRSGAAGSGTYVSQLIPLSTDVSGVLAITNGGTGATTQAGAQAALGITSAGLTATGDLAGNVPLVGTGGIIANNVCLGAASGGGISCAKTTTGTGNVVLSASPTFTGTIVTPAFQVTGGTLASGKVLTSDASGNATWQTPTAGVGGSGTITYVPYFNSSSTLANSPMTISASNVGIGMTAVYLLDVNGTARVTNLIYNSDRRLKTHVNQIENALNSLLSFSGVTYYWNDLAESRGLKEQNRQIGFIAQEVEKVFPEAVKESTDGFKSINYPALIAPTVQAVKELYVKFVQTKNIHERRMASIEASIANKDVIISNLQSENSAMKYYLCSKDPKAKFCDKNLGKK